MHSPHRKGFTLIELLVVIAIIAILSVVVILTLNPAELLRQSRDSNRVSDLSVTKSAIALYLVSVITPSVGSSSFCYEDTASTSANLVSNTIGTSTCVTWFITQNVGSTTASISRKVDGSGWIPVNFSAITAGGSPLSQLPMDPLNNDGNHLYTYIASSTGLVFKLDANMESTKYSTGGANDVESVDGGQSTSSYEQGTNLSL